MIDPMGILISDVEERNASSELDMAFDDIRSLDKENAKLKSEINRLNALVAELTRKIRDEALPIDIINPPRLTLLREE